MFWFYFLCTVNVSRSNTYHIELCFHSFCELFSIFTLFCWYFRNSSAGRHHIWSAPFLSELILFFYLSKTVSSPGVFVVALFVRAAAPLSKRVHTMRASHDHDRDMTTWWNSAVFWRKVLVMQRPGSQRRRVVTSLLLTQAMSARSSTVYRSISVRFLSDVMYGHLPGWVWRELNAKKSQSVEHNFALHRYFFRTDQTNWQYHRNCLWPPFYCARYKKNPHRGVNEWPPVRRWRVKRRPGRRWSLVPCRRLSTRRPSQR